MSKQLGLLPIAVIGGSPTVQEPILRAVWRQMVMEDKVKTVFYDGYVTSEADWIKFIYSPANLGILAYTIDDPKVVTIAWLNSHSGNFAFGHFCTLGDHPIPGVGEMILEFWANLKNDLDMPYYELVLGLIPSPNVKAHRFIEKLGFERVGEIPKICTMAYEDQQVPGILFYLDLGRYRNGRG